MNACATLLQGLPRVARGTHGAYIVAAGAHDAGTRAAARMGTHYTRDVLRLCLTLLEHMVQSEVAAVLECRAQGVW